MDRRLLIHLDIDANCNIHAIDHSNYLSLGDDILDHVVLEFFTDKDSNIIYQKTNVLKHNRDYLLQDFSTLIPLPSDGTFTYYKLIIPCLSHFEVYGDQISRGMQEIEKYEVADKYFFHRGRFYYSSVDIVPEDGISKFEEVTDFFELWHNKDDQGFFWFSNNIFSICKLEKCLVSLQRKTLENCFTNKCKDTSDSKYQRDFILDSVFVLRYLVSVNNYTEAQRILDNLSSCGSLCEDELDASLNGGCNCGNPF